MLRICNLAATRTRYGCFRIYILLRGEGSNFGNGRLGGKRTSVAYLSLKL